MHIPFDGSDADVQLARPRRHVEHHATASNANLACLDGRPVDPPLVGCVRVRHARLHRQRRGGGRRRDEVAASLVDVEALD